VKKKAATLFKQPLEKLVIVHALFKPWNPRKTIQSKRDSTFRGLEKGDEAQEKTKKQEKKNNKVKGNGRANLKK
jgi:hypothetical protein